MKVVLVGREQALKRISEDTRVADIMDELIRHPPVLSFLLPVIRRFHSHDELIRGRMGDGQGTLAQYVAAWKGQKRHRPRVQRIATAIQGLYRDNTGGEGNVRGALLENVVETKLRVRYGGSSCLLTNNARFELVNNETTYSSGADSIDVIAFDGRVGECHDCKVNAKRFADQRTWINDLTSNVAPRGFKIGLVTASHRKTAERDLREAGVSTRTATLIPADELHLLAPLQPF